MRAAALALALTLLPLSCQSRLSKEEYAARADAICTKYNREIGSIQRPHRLKDLPAYVDRALPVARKGTDELRRLRPPANEDSIAKDWLAQNDAVVAAMQQLRTAAKRGDRLGVQSALADATTANRTATRFARQLGLRVCARG
jgi:hypothetical protein